MLKKYTVLALCNPYFRLAFTYLSGGGCFLRQLGDPDKAFEEHGGRWERNPEPKHLQHRHLHVENRLTVVRVVRQPNQLIHLPAKNIKNKVRKVNCDFSVILPGKNSTNLIAISH